MWFPSLRGHWSRGPSWSRPSLANPMADGINAALLWPSSQRTVLVFFPFSPTFSSQTISAIPRTLITIYLYANHYQTYISNPLLFLEFQIGTPYCLIYIYFECLTDNSNLTCQKSNSKFVPPSSSKLHLSQTFSNELFKPKTWASLILIFKIPKEKKEPPGKLGREYIQIVHWTKV